MIRVGWVHCVVHLTRSDSRGWVYKILEDEQRMISLLVQEEGLCARQSDKGAKVPNEVEIEDMRLEGIQNKRVRTVAHQ